MDEPIKFNYVLTCEFNEEKREFRVTATENDLAFESLILSLTIEEVKRHLIDVARQTLDRLQFISIVGIDD